MALRNLTIQEAAASTNLWFKVVSEEEQRMFQEEFFRQGGSWVDNSTEVQVFEEAKAYEVEGKGLCYRNDFSEFTTEQVQIIRQEEKPSITIDGLTPDVTLKVTLDTSLNWQDTLILLTSLKIEELTKDFISDKCLRKMEDAPLASLARFFVEKQTGATDYTCGLNTAQMELVKAFVLTTKNYLTKRTKQREYWYKFYRKEVENIVRQAQAGLYQEELKNSPEWEGLSWERRGEA